MFDFNNEGYALAGIHKVSIEDYYNHFVIGFSDSYTRKRNWDSLTSVVLPELLRNYKIIDYLWIDGSYSTRKLNPNDIDIIIFADFDPLNTVEYNQYLELSKRLQLHKNHYDKLFCDLYCLPSKRTMKRFNNSPNMKLREIGSYFQDLSRYWLGQFGFDREDRPKGIYEIQLGGDGL